MFPICTGIYFWTAHEPKVGYGLGTLCFLMMKHTAVGGVFETLSSLLKPPLVCPSDATERSSLLVCSEAVSSSELSTRLMGERQRRLIFAGIIFHYGSLRRGLNDLVLQCFSFVDFMVHTSVKHNIAETKSGAS